MREVNKKVFVIAAVFLIVAFSASSIAPVLADTVITEYQYTGGNAIIDVPGKTRIRIIAFSGWSSRFGRADRIDVVVDTETEIGEPPVWVPGVAYEDDAERWAFSKDDIGMYVNPPVLVKPWQIGMFKMGKTNFVYWTVPLVVPAFAPLSLPDVVIPPGMLVLRGCGDPNSGQMGPVEIGPNGWTVETAGSWYSASATFLCPGWHYYGPVGEDFEGTPMQARSCRERTWIWTLPDT